VDIEDSGNVIKNTAKRTIFAASLQQRLPNFKIILHSPIEKSSFLCMLLRFKTIEHILFEAEGSVWTVSRIDSILCPDDISRGLSPLLELQTVYEVMKWNCYSYTQAFHSAAQACRKRSEFSPRSGGSEEN